MKAVIKYEKKKNYNGVTKNLFQMHEFILSHKMYDQLLFLYTVNNRMKETEARLV